MTVDQELRRATTSLAGVEVAVPPYARLRRRQRARRATGALAGAVVALLAIVAVASLLPGDEGAVRVTSEGSTTTAPSPSSTASPTVPAIDPDASVAAFCAAVTEGGSEVPESYTGSPEHIANVTRYAALAPSEIRAQIETYLAFLEAGGIDPADPDSNLVENFPPPVRDAARGLEDYVAATC